MSFLHLLAGAVHLPVGVGNMQLSTKPEISLEFFSWYQDTSTPLVPHGGRCFTLIQMGAAGIGNGQSRLELRTQDSQ